ncbi:MULTISPECIES: SDR family NAD(P)-dependent oxidoreductase [Sphingobium]|jgi:NAD(P)-dependent dehydrogenase (short-subunit alcohol dehydrogenase family)|nr:MULTISPECIES: SDR family NAD(P)-dependent oxidoreductase [Sphingobium]WRD75532.1 SDR family oxidoreductase [Sphingobium baderi]
MAMANVIVAGGLGILGRGVVAELAARGHKVAVVDFANGAIEGAEVIGGCDLADEAAVSAAYAKADKALGGIDGLVNVAGGFVWELVDGGSLDSWDRMYRMNVRTAIASSRAVLPYLKAGSAIVNVGAAAVAAPGAGMAPYTASKAGVAALTESLAEELREKGIRVNAVLPTIIDTPVNRADMPDADTSSWVKPSSAAKVIAFLLSQEAASITGVGIKLSLAG